MRVPTATYRVQFSSAFTFADAQAILPYLSRLGISDLYASPIFQAQRGSTHGYDVTDPQRLNPELGSEEAFEALVRELKSRDMGLLLDIVPNHMAVSEENPWWWDVLDKGPSSPYAGFFDIDWHPTSGEMENQVLLPVLGRSLEESLERQEVTLVLEDGAPVVRYYDRHFPVNIKSCGLVLAHRLDETESVLGKERQGFRVLRELVSHMEKLPLFHNVRARTRTWALAEEELRQRLRGLLGDHSEVEEFVRQNVARFNDRGQDSQGLALMERLLALQAYRLAFWRTGVEEVNYRRFFDVSDLVGLRVEDSNVLGRTHRLILQMVREGKITGLRIDHIDGLQDPLLYLRRLRRGLATRDNRDDSEPGFYVLVEKILLGDEALPTIWPVSGTTGYDFVNTVNGLFVDGPGVQALQAVYRRVTGLRATFSDVVHEKKHKAMLSLFPGEVRSLVYHLHSLAGDDPSARTLSLESLEDTLVEVTACLPVYRTYVRATRVSPSDRRLISTAFDEARRRSPSLEPEALAFLRRVLLLDALPEPSRREWLNFVMRWQQFTGPVMAKGLEDTALYHYNALISLNEVGGGPGAGAMPVDLFHRRSQERQKLWPHTLNATSTHDTKRSEDVRARINVLSEIPREWETHLLNWRRWNRSKKARVRGRLVPETHMEVLLYQTLLGAWPLSSEEVPAFVERLKAYLVKAAREAKSQTSWLSPNLPYEDALQMFIDAITVRSVSSPFLEDMRAFQRRTAFFGALNSLGQVLLKVTSPGVPDFYQGTALWDFSLVDPDNRRPVDFAMRQRLARELAQDEERGLSYLIEDLLGHWEDGRIKRFVTQRALSFRKSHQDVFLRGEYMPLGVEGERNGHVCAFARHYGQQWAIIVVPRLLTWLTPASIFPLGQQAWGDDSLLLPEGAPFQWENKFTEESIGLNSPVDAGSRSIPLSRLFASFPLALLSGSN